MSKEVVRLNVNMNEETAAKLKKICDKRGISYTEGIRRAISVLAYLIEEKDNGRTILTQNAKGRKTKELIILD